MEKDGREATPDQDKWSCNYPSVFVQGNFYFYFF
jgi:hypothetical protein